MNPTGNTILVAGRRQAALDAAIAGRANMHAMILDIDDAAGIAAFAADVSARFPALNILVQRVLPLRFAERDGFAAMLDRLNGPAHP